MKLQILSDLHLEFGPCEVPDVGANVVILAGDIFTGTGGPSWARSAFPARRIVYVPGNDEYYGTTVDGEDARLGVECRRLSIDMLQMGALDPGGVRVDPDDVLFRPIDGMALHARARRWLEEDEGPQ